MAVEDFLKPSESKQTVEKLVAQKPKFSDLVTIESPGRPTPALQLEDSEAPKKKTRRPRKRVGKGNVTKITSKDATLIITEKPQAAEKIARALGSPVKLSEGRVNYFELSINNKTIFVASAVGHLYNLTYTKGQKGWPVFDLEWQPSHEQNQASKFTKPYLTLLKKLAKQSSEFVVATDFDIEGEVIGWNVLRFLCNRQDAKRMKYSTLTTEELKSSFQNLRPTLEWGNAYAGEARHKIDWLYGINFSRALMSAIKTAGSFKILSIGRVQGPALKIIVDREKEITNFKAEPYWNVFANSNKLKFKHPTDIFQEKELEKFKPIKEANATTSTQERKTPPPVPFDLTTLQREAYRLHRLSPSATLKLAQKLYLAGLISYPRTSSQKIPDSIKPLSILKKLSRVFPEASKTTRKTPMQGRKSDPAHPSIYPTGDIPKKIQDQELNLYNLIVKRFISCFYNDLITSNRKITLESIPEKLLFTLSGQTLIDKGWAKVYPVKVEELQLPELSGKVKVDKISFEEKLTKAPQRYTPTGLVSLLEKKNLGTKATRSSIVDTLFNRGYLHGNSIQATQLGINLISALEKHSSIIVDENLTRSLEEEMEKIQLATEDFQAKEEQLLEKTKTIITDISKEFKIHENEIGKEIGTAITDQRTKDAETNVLMPCTTCNKGNLRIMYSKKFKSYFVGCSSYPTCKQTYSLPPGSLIKNTGEKDSNGLPLLLSIKKGKKPWKFPFNPNWKKEQERAQQ
jgi:DNA topoisomerase-1